MKKETIEKAKKLLNSIDSTETVLDKIDDSRHYLSEIRIKKSETNSGDRTIVIELDNNGKITSQSWLSDKSKVIFTYTVKRFYDSIIELFKEEKNEITKEFDNLKD